MAPSNQPAYVKDERALCFHHELLYEAKVLESRLSDESDKKSPLQYRVHYKGWKNTWDDWVPQDRLRKYNDDNKELAANLKREMDLLRQRSAPKTTASSKKKTAGSDLSSTRGSEERHSSVPVTGRGQKRGRDFEIEKVGDDSFTLHSSNLPLLVAGSSAGTSPSSSITDSTARTSPPSPEIGSKWPIFTDGATDTPRGSPPIGDAPQDDNGSTSALSSLSTSPSASPGGSNAGTALGGKDITAVASPGGAAAAAEKGRAKKAKKKKKKSKASRKGPKTHASESVASKSDSGLAEPADPKPKEPKEDIANPGVVDTQPRKPTEDNAVAQTAPIETSKPKKCKTKFAKPPSPKQEDAFTSKLAVKIPMPDNLKSILVDDWEQVTKNQALVPLPVPHPVNEILDMYTTDELQKRRVGSAEYDILQETIHGLREYFDKCLGKILLYKLEREQFHEMRALWEGGIKEWEGKGPGDVYGAEHLIRLFSSMPELIAQTNMDQQSVNRLREELGKICQWISKRASSIFTVAYEPVSNAYIERMISRQVKAGDNQ